MNRKSFIKNSLMSLAIAMLPKILRPVDIEDEIICEAQNGNITMTLDESIGEPPEWAKHYGFLKTEPLFHGFVYYHEDGSSTYIPAP